MSEYADLLYPGLREMGKYQTIVMDPPWPTGYSGKSPARKGEKWAKGWDYPQLPIEDILEIPMESIMDDDCIVFIWTVMGHPVAPHTLMRRWGIQYMYEMIWMKNGGPKAGVYRPTYNHEKVVVGRKGNPDTQRMDGIKTANHWPRRQHSKKPDEFYEMLLQFTPSPRLDIFARDYKEGFAVYGNELPDSGALSVSV